MELLVSFLVSDLRNGSDGLFAGPKSHIRWINTSLKLGFNILFSQKALKYES